MVESTGCTKFEEARTWIRKRLGAIARNEPVQVRADRVTFAQMAERLREDYRVNGKHLPTLDIGVGLLCIGFALQIVGTWPR